MNIKRNYGCILERIKDRRDYRFCDAPKITGEIFPFTQWDEYKPPARDQGEEGCHDDKTEVLTDKGWIGWSDYNWKDLLGTVNPISLKMEFQEPTKKYIHEYDGPLYKINHRSLNFGLTPTHRMFSKKWNEEERTLSSKFTFKIIKDVGFYEGLLSAPNGFDGGIQLNELSIDEQKYSGNDFLALLALVISDGWVGGTENNKNVVGFCCFNLDRIEMIRALAQKLEFNELPGRQGVWKKANPTLANWLHANIYTNKGHTSPYKKIPSIVKEASPYQIEHFFNYYGDKNVNKINGRRSFYTSSVKLADDIQELLLRVGKRSGFSTKDAKDVVMNDGRMIHKENCHKGITVNEWQKDTLSIERKKQIYTDNYKGLVFCAEVPNSTLITRREGQILISGNSCTAHGWTGACKFLMLRNGLPLIDLSVQFLYHNELMADATFYEKISGLKDKGSQIGTGAKCLTKQGVCPELMFPYFPGQFKNNPSAACYKEARNHQMLAYYSVKTVDEMRAALSNKLPVVYGIPVYESFESEQVARTGIVPMPKDGEKLLGYHCVWTYGHDDKTRLFIDQNSWGKKWGIDEGSFKIPYEYVAKWATDARALARGELM